MPFRDLREFIAKLEKEGEVQRIKEEVDWYVEAGAMLRQSHESGLPAPFFEKIKGYPAGYTLCGGTAAKYRRLAIAMERDPETPQKELMEVYLRGRHNPIKPVLVKDGPCKENIHLGSEVDLLEFPVPLVHSGDGGRYLGTWHLTVTKDPDSDWVNWGMYRHMLHNENTVAMGADPMTHAGTMYTQRCEPRGKPMDVTIAIGVEPISTLCAGAMMPYGISEVDVAGGIRGEPIEQVKCETVDLAVPATAEIVVEGRVTPKERMDEGPFGEFTGYRCAGRLSRPVVHVTAVTHRNNPIFTMANEGMPLADSHTVCGLTKGAEILDSLRVQGLPVTNVCVFGEASYMLAVIAVKPTFANVASQIAYSVWATRSGRSTPCLFIVNDDVDPFNMAQVLHALATKCHPYNGIVTYNHTVGGAYFPWQNRHERQNRMGGKAYFDCTWPMDWDASEIPPKVSFADIYPPEIQEKSRAKWRKYGY